MNNTAELVFILDQSGSMCDQTSDVIGGFNAMIEKQKAEQGMAWVSTVLFFNETRVLHDRQKISEVKKMTNRDYQPSGMTALYDAIGFTIEHIAQIHKYIRPEDVPAKTIFMITTDGLENASRHFSQNKVKALIEKMKKERGWEFVFAAANIDSEKTAQSIGIGENRAASFNTSQEGGVEQLFENMSETLCCMRRASFQAAQDIRPLFEKQKPEQKSEQKSRRGHSGRAGKSKQKP